MKHYALVVGIGDYDQSIIPSLSKPKTDAEAVWDTLQESGLYQDVALLNRHVTRSVLQASLETLLLKRGKQSNVLLYFTGHGFTAGEDEYDTQGYLATQDCEVQVVNQKVKTVRNGFSFLSLNGIIEQAELSSLVVFLDCCYSGFFVEKNQIRKNFSVFGRSNYFLVTACRSFEEAYAWKSAEHSIFSSALLKALRENSSQITAFEVFQRIERELKGSGQEPLYIGAGGDISLLRRQQVVFPSEVKEECPYRGLEPFTPETSEFFFGRDYEVGLLRQKLENFNFVMLLGSSGSGKSSVVKAGLVPYLRKNEWQVMTMTPGDNPISVLRLQLKNYMDLQQILESRQRDLLLIFDQKGLPAFAESVASEIPTHKRMLLVIDQFEEVFTQCDVDKQKKFIRSLLALLKIPSPIFVVGTMRADFFHHWLETGQPTSVIQENAVILGPLLGDNLVSVIVEPAKKQGYRLEEGLLRLLLQDVEEEKDSLPLLEFTLTELWHGRDIDERQLTVKTYEKISGLQGALNKRAMSIYDGLQSDEYRVWMKRICLQLVRIGRAGYDTRQRQPISLLLDMAGKDNQSQQKILDVIAKMISGRLLVSGNNWHPNIEHESEDDKDRKEERFAYLDIAHEALLEGWQKFKEWRQENRDQRRLVQRLEDAYAEWKKKGERKEYLLTGGLLLEISEQWDDIRHIPKGKRRSILTEFFLFSKEHKRSEISGSTQDFTRSRLKEAADQTRAKLRLAPAKSVDAAIKAIELTEQSQTNLDNQEITGPIQSLLYSVFCSVWEKIKIEAHDDWITAIAFSPQDDVVVSASFDRSLRLWDLDGNPLGPRFSGHTDWVTSAVFSADGQLIISGSSDGTIRLWNLDGEAVGQPFLSKFGQVTSVAISPKGDYIVGGTSAGVLELWDCQGNAIGKPFIGHSDQVNDVAFNANGDRIISAGNDGRLILWNLQGNFQANPLTGNGSSATSVTFDKEGKKLISGSSNSTLQIIKVEKDYLRIDQEIECKCGQLNSVKLNNEENRILMGGSDGNLRLFNLEKGLFESTLYVGHDSKVTSVDFHPFSEDLIVSASQDKTIRFWHTNNQLASYACLQDVDSRGRKNKPRVSVLDISKKGFVAFESEGTFSERKVHICHIKAPDRTYRHEYKGSIRAVSFDAEGSCLAVSNWRENDDFISKKEVIFDTLNFKNSDISSQRVSHNYYRNQYSNSKDPKFVLAETYLSAVSYSSRYIAGDRRGYLYFNCPSRDMKTVQAHKGEITRIVCNLKGDRMVSCSKDTTLQIWDTWGNPLVEPMVGHVGAVRAAAFSPNDDFVVSGSEDGTLRLWDMRGNSVGKPFVGHQGAILSVDFNSKGNLIVSGSQDGTLRLWNLEGDSIGEPLSSYAAFATFNDNDDVICSGSNVVYLWKVRKQEDWLYDCCTRLIHHPKLTVDDTETSRRVCDVCSQVWTKQQTLEFLKAQGDALAQIGKVEQAVLKYSSMQDMGHHLSFDPHVRANQLAEYMKPSQK